MTALVIGEAVLDVVHATAADRVERPGGSAVNVAVALARLGRPVRLATGYADDPAGALIGDHLRAAGVGLAGDPHLLASTARADAVIDGTGAASYSFDIGWRLPVLPDESCHVVHVTSLAPLLDPGAEDVLALIERIAPGTCVTYDVNLRPAITGTGPEIAERVLRTAASATLVKASDEDLLALWPDRTVGEAASALLGLARDGRGPVAVVVTHGGEGASWHACSGADWSTGGIHARPVEVVDTIGAGDTFAAGLLDHLWPLLGPGARERLCALGPDDWSAALTWAARAAAVTVGRVGADPPTRAEMTGSAT